MKTYKDKWCPSLINFEGSVTSIFSIALLFFLLRKLAMAFQASTSRLSSHADPEKKSIESGYYVPTEHEKRILDRQLEVAPVKGSYRMLFRYATPTDLFIIFVSSICSIAAGVIFPLMTACSTFHPLLDLSNLLSDCIRLPYNELQLLPILTSRRLCIST
jgi:hypothetical protein